MHKPFHSCEHVEPRRLKLRVLLIVGEGQTIFLLEVVLFHDESSNVDDVVDAASQRRRGARVIAADEECPLLSFAARELEMIG